MTPNNRVYFIANLCHRVRLLFYLMKLVYHDAAETDKGRECKSLYRILIWLATSGNEPMSLTRSMMVCEAEPGNSLLCFTLFQFMMFVVRRRAIAKRSFRIGSADSCFFE